MFIYNRLCFILICIFFVSYYSAAKRVRRQSGWFGQKPPNASCLFNLCNSEGYCDNGGTCTLNEENCMSYCTCPDSFSGPRCKVSLLTSTSDPQDSSSTLPTTRSLEDRKCSEIFVCDHGYCSMASGGFGCICDPHWTGALCNQFDCDISCPAGSRCEARNEVPVCVEYDTTTTTTTTVATSGDYVSLRPIEDRQCLSTFICKHGVCEKLGSVGFRCKCDPTWSDLFCDRSLCPAECPGNCVIMTNGSYTCDKDDPIIDSLTQTFEPLDACDANYTMRPIEERKCNAMTCVYGSCKERNTTFTVGEEAMIGTAFYCACDEHVDGILCNKKCCLDCGENGRCELNGTEPFCNCKTHQWMGPFCNETRPEAEFVKETWYLWVVGVCAFVLLLLVLTLVVLPYMMWRHRVTLVMKIVYYFQSYEDNDERKWDAFVAFRSGGDDEDFVLNTLRPMLEDELGFSLCLHFRDFTPGETIANNIIESLNDSRRTILIVSPRFVESEFLQFEYQIAQEQMLRRKQRIIPIILEDISSIDNTTDPNLKQILKSVTYIEWPDQSNEKKTKTFWKRLELSMPKRKSVEEKQRANKSLTEQSNTSSNGTSTKKSSKRNGVSRKENSSDRSTSSQIKIISHDNIAFELENDKNVENKNDLNVNIEKYMTMMGNGNSTVDEKPIT